MWFVFLMACIVIAFVALAVFYVGHKLFLIMERENRKADMEDAVYKEAQKIIKEKMKKENKK